jgi:hypothetical protein
MMIVKGPLKPLPEMLNTGHQIVQVSLDNEFKDLILKENWAALDSKLYSMCNKSGAIFELLTQIRPFKEIEHIIAMRQSPDEDGIWHDDGSRQLAFSLSLNMNCEKIEGGELSIRKKGHHHTISTIPTLPFGSMIIFLTGHDYFEHKTHCVREGKRLVAAGWCTA